MRSPRNPLHSLLWAIGWGLTAAFGLVMLAGMGAELWEHSVSASYRGARAGLFLLILPVFSVVMLLYCAWRTVSAIGPWQDYAPRTTAQQRRLDADARLSDAPLGLSVLFAVLLGLTCAASVTAAVIVVPSSSGGAPFAAMLGMIAAASGTGFVGLIVFLVRRSRVDRRAKAAQDPRVEAWRRGEI